MSYEKQNFLHGQIVTADHLNHIEDGIVAAADAETLGSKAPEYYIQPRNLLDNSDFLNPVNQRGAASYSTQWTYTIDRWYLPGSTVPVTVGGGYVSFCTADQFIGKEIKDGYYTAAIKLLDGRVFSGSAYYTAGKSATMLANNGVIDCYLMGDAGSGAHPRLRFQTVSGAAISFVWAAFYEGSYTADTLPPYIPKGYAAELAECMRYYQTIPYYIAQNGINENASYPSCFPMNFFPMRIVPTATLKESWNSNVISKTINNVTTQSLSVGFALDSNSNGFLQWKGTIILSADL